MIVLDASKNFLDTHKSLKIENEFYLLRRINNISFIKKIDLALI